MATCFPNPLVSLFLGRVARYGRMVKFVLVAIIGSDVDTFWVISNSKLMLNVGFFLFPRSSNPALIKQMLTPQGTAEQLGTWFQFRAVTSPTQLGRSAF